MTKPMDSYFVKKKNYSNNFSERLNTLLITHLTLAHVQVHNIQGQGAFTENPSFMQNQTLAFFLQLAINWTSLEEFCREL